MSCIPAAERREPQSIDARRGLFDGKTLFALLHHYAHRRRKRRHDRPGAIDNEQVNIAPRAGRRSNVFQPSGLARAPGSTTGAKPGGARSEGNQK
jgi:hypothetical protein